MKKYFDKMQEELGFELREGQRQMSEIIQNSLENEENCLIEAGTGIGKTISYLLPAILYCKRNNKKVVVSTNTINLQEQILNKEIPILSKILNEDIKCAIVKGRSNYACGNRILENSKDEKIIAWYKKTKTGDKSEIDFFISNDDWNLIKSDYDFCSNNNCAKSGKCFFYSSRKELNKCDVLIVNHALLFSDLKYSGILPEYDVLILDEAHNIENIARSYYEDRVNSKELGYIIGSIHNNKTNKGYLKEYISSIADLADSKDELNNYLRDFIENFNGIYEKIQNIFSLYTISVKKSINVNKIEAEQNKNKEIFSKVLEYSYKLQDLYIKINKEFTNYINKEKLSNFDLFFLKLIDQIKIMKMFFDEENENIRWIDVQKGSLSLVATPLDISNNFKLLFEDKKVVMTSATLTIDGKFDYLVSRLGLNEFNKYLVSSPFDYDKNMQILLSSKNIDPNSEKHIENSINFLNEFLKNEKEGSFVLCTSYSQIDKISNGIKNEHLKILKQNDMSNTNLLNNFKNEKSILIATDSFWEGVDVKGDMLKNVIIVKIPFQVPDDPVTEALIESIKKEDKNPFLSYQLPNAIIKLRQGIGRLIRSKEDSGKVIILDSRVTFKFYGKKIINSLPSKNIKYIEK